MQKERPQNKIRINDLVFACPRVASPFASIPNRRLPLVKSILLTIELQEFQRPNRGRAAFERHISLWKSWNVDKRRALWEDFADLGGGDLAAVKLGDESGGAVRCDGDE